MEKRSVPWPFYEVSPKPQKADQPPLNETNCFLFPKSLLIHCVRYRTDQPHTASLFTCNFTYIKRNNTQINCGDKHLVKTHRGK